MKTKWKEENQGTQHRELEADIKRINRNRKQLQMTAQDIVTWMILIGGLCSATRGDKRR